MMTREHSSASSPRAYLGICTVAFLSLFAIYVYFVDELPINSPGKILEQMVYLFAAVFFLYETRLSMGREKWRPYIAFGFISALIAAYSSIPSLIYYFATDFRISGSIYEMALTVTLFFFILSRILLAGSLIQDKESAIAMIFKSASEARTEEISPKPAEEAEDLTPEETNEESANDENQISIDDFFPAESEYMPQDTSEAALTEEDLNTAEADDGNNVKAVAEAVEAITAEVAPEAVEEATKNTDASEGTEETAKGIQTEGGEATEGIEAETSRIAEVVPTAEADASETTPEDKGQTDPKETSE